MCFAESACRATCRPVHTGLVTCLIHNSNYDCQKAAYCCSDPVKLPLLLCCHAKKAHCPAAGMTEHEAAGTSALGLGSCLGRLGSLLASSSLLARLPGDLTGSPCHSIFPRLLSGLASASGLHTGPKVYCVFFSSFWYAYRAKGSWAAPCHRLWVSISSFRSSQGQGGAKHARAHSMIWGHLTACPPREQTHAAHRYKSTVQQAPAAG